MDAIYQGLCNLYPKVPIRVIWALKSETVKLPDGYDKNRFYTSTWMPQIEILAHPATKVCISHMGLGGTFECMNAGVTPLAFPHFGDQRDNTENLLDKGACIALSDPTKGDRPASETENHKFDTP